MSLLYPTNHEETETRLFLHVRDLARQSFQKTAIRTALHFFTTLLRVIRHPLYHILVKKPQRGINGTPILQ